MKILTFTLPFLLLLINLTGCHSQKEENANRPNVVIILTDDQGFGDIGFNGNTKIETPFLDQLSIESVKFNNFYVSPVCAPTRASLLTGRYHYHTGTYWVSNGKENMNPNEYTLAELFKDNGYTTGAFGKWHNGSHYPFHPNRQGYDKFVGFCMGHWNNYFNTTIEENGKPVLAEGYLPDYLTQRAIEFITQNKSNPFFCYVPYNTPHSPFQVPNKYFEKYKAKGLDDKTACIYGMCENIDDNVELLIDALQKEGILDNTLVIYMSDNGPVPGRYNANLRGTKGHIHEGGVKVPFIISLPKQFTSKNTPQEINQIAAHIDIMPTLIDLLELNNMQQPVFDGLSLKKVIHGKHDSLLDNRIFYNKAPQRDPEIWGGAVRTGDYRLVLKNKDTLLFNLKKDPSEKNNLAKVEKKLANSLASNYFNWIAKTIKNMPSFTAIPVGVKGQKRIHMPAHEAIITGNIKFKEGHGWANDWIWDMQNNNDSIYWNIECITGSKYKASLLYTLNTDTPNLNINISTNNKRYTSLLNQNFIPDIILSPDHFPRKEIHEQTWKKYDLGIINTETNDNYLSISISNNNSNSGNNLEIKALTLEIID